MTVMEPRQPFTQPAWRVLVTTWLVTASWDFVCATLLSVVGYHTTFSRLWQGVASVPFGPTTIDSGARGVALGLLAHLSVALAWSLIFVGMLRFSESLRRAIATRGGALAVAAVYGPIIWLVMSLGVIHTVTGKIPAFNHRWWIQVFAHIPFVSIPLVFTARSFLKLPETRKS